MKKANSTKLQNILLIVLGIIVILLSIVNLVKETSNYSENELLILEEECLLDDGNWLGEYNECEGISQEKCEKLGGVFQDCASACRHQNSEFCIEVCVQVCSF